jgi:hypothetical protein
MVHVLTEASQFTNRCRHTLVNMEYERPSLEEVFLTYYEQEN